MTQALLNNLNNINDKVLNFADKMQKSEKTDFGKIFETTSKMADNNDKTPKTDSIKDTNNKEKILNKTTENTQQAKPSDSEEDICTKENKISNTDNSTTENTVANTQTDTQKTISEDTKSLNNSTDTNNEENEINLIQEEELTILTEELSENTDDNQDTITTNEEPTMYNELNTLNDSAAIILLQSQIQKTVNVSLENEECNSGDENTNMQTPTKNSSLNNSANNLIFKQFDNITQKNSTTQQIAPVFTPKAETQTKNESTRSSGIISENIVKELNVEVLSAQSSETESSMGDLMKNQSPQEQTARIMIQGNIKSEQAYNSVTAAKSIDTKMPDITPSKIIEQISKQLEGMYNTSKLNMVLNPGSLGKVNLQLMNSKDGLIAQFTVTTKEAHELLLKGINGLKENLLAQGVNFDNVSVKLEEFESEYNFDWTEQEGSRGGNKQQNTKKQQENDTTFEKIFESDKDDVIKEA